MTDFGAGDVEPGFVDADVETAWVAEHCGLSEGMVATVLAIEMEFMADVGISAPPDGYEFTWYSPEELADEPRGQVDTQQVARDVERLSGIPASVADRVFEAEFEFSPAPRVVTNP